jgi:hypothetical protein
MDITGRLVKIMPEVRGESQRGPWVRGGFVIETEDTYPKQVAFTLFGEDRLAMINGMQMNSQVVVTFSPESREFNDRWYTDLRCIRVLPMQGGAAASAQPGGQSAAQPQNNANFAQPPMPAGDNDDLPF